MIDCTWNAPGADPYRGPVAASVAAAVARYKLPPADQAELVRKARMLAPDGIIVITRDGITSTDGVATDLREMHHGKPGRVCAGPVVRSKWRDDQAETALIYCSGNTCIAVPTICGNVSRITWVPATPPTEPEFRAWGKEVPHDSQPQAPGRGHLPGPQTHPRISTPTPIPEPSSLLLVATGIALLAAIRWRNR